MRTPINSPEVEAAFEAVPPEMVAEIIDGELYTSPRPHPRHGRSASKLGGILDGPFDTGRDGPGGWVILDEPELHLGPRPDKLVPDLAGWRRERLPDDVFEPDAPAAIKVAPDWACEVLSARTETVDRGKKMRVYRRERVGHVWLINPVTCTLEVYRLDDGRYILMDTHTGDTGVRAEPFDAIELPLGALWRR